MHQGGQSLSRLCVEICRIYQTSMLEAKIYCQTDIFSELRLQRSKHGSNCARSKQQDNAGTGIHVVFDT